LKTGGGEPNWPITAYLSGMVLAAGWLREDLTRGPLWYRRLAATAVGAGCAIGLVLTVAVHHSEWLHPLLARVTSRPTHENPMPLRRLDPTLRLRGWVKLAAEVDDLREELRREGKEPIVAASGWSLPGELAFYAKGHP